MGPEDFPRLTEVTVDLRVLLFALCAALLPRRSSPRGAMPRNEFRQSFRRLWPAGQGALVAAEIAWVSLAGLIQTSLMFQSLWRLQPKNIGCQPEHILTATIWQPRPLDEIRRLVGSIPGVSVIGFGDSLHPNYGCCSSVFSREGRPLPEGWHRGDTMIVGHVSPGYFEALGIPLLRGRFFTAADAPDKVAIVNQTLVRTYFPAEDPIGKKIDLVLNAPKTIVGIVADAKNRGLDDAAVPGVRFYPLRRRRWT